MFEGTRSLLYIPFFFTPVPINGNLYFDGGLCDNLPYKISEDCPETLVVVVYDNPIGDVGKRKVIKIKSEINSFSILSPAEDLEKEYPIGRLRARRVIQKEKND